MITFEKYVEDLVKKNLVSKSDAGTFLGKDVDDGSDNDLKNKAG